MTVDELKGAMEALTAELQSDICTALERVDGEAHFREDPWTRPGGGGGRTRVLAGGRVIEKAGVNVSAVHGQLDEAFAKRMPGDGREFYAAGISLIIHPRNPFAPTTHANFRFISHGQKAWFGGGADLTPYYLFEEDAAHFHRTFKSACDRHDAAYYPRFKKTCDEYFWLKHRAEARGIGGLFFEDIGGVLEKELEFVRDCGRAFLPAYLPILEKRKDTPYAEPQRAWQELRRGRYVEFNLLYDRGTVFGLETGGRTESILVSLPPIVRWAYAADPPEGTPEWHLVEALRHPRAWV